MRLVFLNQYFPPDAAPTGVMLRDLVEALAYDGHEVTVLCAAGGYADDGRVVSDCAGRADRPRSADLSPAGQDANAPPDDHSCVGEATARRDRHAQPPTANSQPPTLHPPLPPPTANRQPPILHIHRIRATSFGRGTFIGKLLDYASYYAGAGWKLLTIRPAPDRIVAMTTPPYLSVLARLLSKLRGADHAHWVMDLYPDVLAAHGMLDERGLTYRLLARLARWGFGGNRCAAVLTLGPDMAERVGKRVGGGRWAVGGDCGREPKHSVQAPQTTENSPPPTAPRVHWVPLWGARDVGSWPLAVGALVTARDPRTTESEDVVRCPLVEKTQDCKTQETRQEGKAVGRDCGCEPNHGAQTPQPTANRQPPTLSPSPHSMDQRRSQTAATVQPPTANCQPPTLSPSPHSMDQRRSQTAATVQPPTANCQPPTLPPPLALRRVRGWGDDDMVVMYSGNMGLGHRFGEILAAVEEFAVGGWPLVQKTQDCKTQDTREEGEDVGGGPLAVGDDCDCEPKRSAQAPQPTANCQPPTASRLRLVFFGGGKRRGEVEAFAREHPDCGVELDDYAPANDLAAHLQSADVHLASLDPAWTGTMVPSKLQGIFCAGRPVIFIGSADSSIGRWVLESGGGWVAAADDVAALLAAITEASDPAERITRGQAAKAFAAIHFDYCTNVSRVSKILTAPRL